METGEKVQQVEPELNIIFKFWMADIRNISNVTINVWMTNSMIGHMSDHITIATQYKLK